MNTLLLIISLLLGSVVFYAASKAYDKHALAQKICCAGVFLTAVPAYVLILHLMNGGSDVSFILTLSALVLFGLVSVFKKAFSFLIVGLVAYGLCWANVLDLVGTFSLAFFIVAFAVGAGSLVYAMIRGLEAHATRISKMHPRDRPWPFQSS